MLLEDVAPNVSGIREKVPSRSVAFNPVLLIAEEIITVKVYQESIVKYTF